jgi:hypothetical protein
MIAKKLWNLKPVSRTEKLQKESKINLRVKITWILLSLMGTVTLLSITNKLTQDIAVVPFLWIIPLSLYLLSYILVFEYGKLYNRKFILPLIVLLIFYILYKQTKSIQFFEQIPVKYILFNYCMVTFMICFAVHGELARKKPEEKHLTLYYLLISIGGVLGSIIINLFMPLILSNYWEYYLAFFGSILLLAYVIFTDERKRMRKISLSLFIISVLATFSFIAYFFIREYREFNRNIISSERNFYGVLKVTEENLGTPSWQRSLTHGDIIHGIQLMDSLNSYLPFTYYAPESGIGLTLTQYPARFDTAYPGMKVGMIGLGIGTISAYSTNKDLYKYYELNPAIEPIARKYFKYLAYAQSKTVVITGDGRKSLERELQQTGSNNFDVLAVDAFSGDVIPAHLLTQEAVEMYMKHLKPGGILAFHITNRYIDLIPVMGGISEYIHLPMNYFILQANERNPISSLWVLFTNNNRFLNNDKVKNQLKVYDTSINPVVRWTDDYSSIMTLLK